MYSYDSAGNAAEANMRLIELATERGVRAGVQAAMDYMRAEQEKAAKGRYDRRLHNTRLLLRNYRRLMLHAEEAISDIKAAKERAIDILEGLEGEDDSLYIESIKRSQTRTLIILQHIDQMLRYYRIDCEQGGRDEDLRRYRVLMATYIDPERKTAQEIADAEHIDKRTVYRDIKEAVAALTLLLFGIDSLPRK